MKKNTSKMKKTVFQAPKGPLEYLYIMEEGQNMRSIYEKIKAETDLTVEYWDAAGVLEITMPEEGNIDMEQSEDEDVLWVTLSSKGYENTVNGMKEIEKVCGGHFEEDR